jgi:hypothetical protein
MAPHANDDYVAPSPATTGPPVPPEVFPEELAAARGDEAPAAAEAEASPAPAGGAGTRPEDRYTEMHKADLEKEADERKVEVTGTGSGGNVTAEDIRDALRKADEPQS